LSVTSRNGAVPHGLDTPWFTESLKLPDELIACPGEPKRNQRRTAREDNALLHEFFLSTVMNPEWNIDGEREDAREATREDAFEDGAVPTTGEDPEKD
jgi:hypothetical protein